SLIVLEAIAGNLTELAQKLDLGADIVGELREPLEHLREPGIVARAVVELRERTERVHVVRLVLEHDVPELNAHVGLLHALGREPSDLLEPLGSLWPGWQRLRVAHAEVNQLLPVPALFVHFAQVLNRSAIERI